MFIHVVNNLRILTITTNVQNDVTCSSQDILLLLFMLNVFSSIIVIPTWNVVCAPCMLERVLFLYPLLIFKKIFSPSSLYLDDGSTQRYPAELACSVNTREALGFGKAATEELGRPYLQLTDSCFESPKYLILKYKCQAPDFHYFAFYLKRRHA